MKIIFLPHRFILELTPTKGWIPIQTTISKVNFWKLSKFGTSESLCIITVK